MTDDELKTLVASLAVVQQKTDQLSVSLLGSQKETDRKLEKASELLGNIGRNQGDVTEEFFFNSLVDDPHLGWYSF